MITIHFSPIETLPNAAIEPKGVVSRAFIDRGVKTFHEASCYVHGLPYGYNGSSSNVMTLFDDGFGTCFEKHGLVARLAEELELSVCRHEGFYSLTDKIVTGVDTILAEYGLPYIPRIHCFLNHEKIYVDLTDGNCTGKNCMIETYLKIFHAKPEQTQSELEGTYRSYYAAVCAEDPIFAKVGVDRMYEILNRCEALNTALCKRRQ